MSKYTNPAHIDNFKTDKPNRVAIFDVTSEIDGTNYFELASGKTLEDAKEALLMRYIVRGGKTEVEKELIMKAQGRMLIVQMKDGQFGDVLERKATLIV